VVKEMGMGRLGWGVGVVVRGFGIGVGV